MRPRRRATAAASVRDAASSLARMLETWTDTVLVLMNSCLPISPLLRPSATSARISLSRGVSVAAADPVAGAGDDPWAVSSASSARDLYA